MHASIFEKRNISMMMDLYEMTMANGYFINERKNGGMEKRVAFDVFYRRNPDGGGFAIFAGLEQIVEYVENIHFDEEDILYLRSLEMFDEDFIEFLRSFRFRGDIYAFPEGTIMYPEEPIITVVAPLIDAQIIETELLALINHESLIATKAQRIVRAAAGRPVSDFGARRAHNNDAAIYGARACYIGGVNGTATVLAGKMFEIPVSGTMAHSWIMFYRDELEAFRRFAEIYPDNCILLADTYDVLRSGVPNAITVFSEMREKGISSKSYGIRLDSGDLAYLSREARKMLDAAGFGDAKIIVSNSLDEFTIMSLLRQDAEIDGFGVGERMITAKSDPVFGAVYKISAVEEESGSMSPRIKISENVEKITNPGLKDVYRVFDSDGYAIADLIAMAGEVIDTSKSFRYVDTQKPWKRRRFENFSLRKLQEKVVEGGRRVKELPGTMEIRDYVKRQLKKEIWEEEQRFENPHRHYIDMTPAYYEMKMDMLHEKEKAEE